MDICIQTPLFHDERLNDYSFQSKILAGVLISYAESNEDIWETAKLIRALGKEDLENLFREAKKAKPQE